MDLPIGNIYIVCTRAGARWGGCGPRDVHGRVYIDVLVGSRVDVHVYVRAGVKVSNGLCSVQSRLPTLSLPIFPIVFLL